jgi:ABC-type ATPase involved in cell division
MRQLSVWSVITEEHTAPALELLQAGTNKDGTTILLTTDQKALIIRIRLDNNMIKSGYLSDLGDQQE